MSNRIYTLQEQEILRSNPNVKSCTSKHISFTADFKLHAVKEYKSGKQPKEIYMESNLPFQIISLETFSTSMERWRYLLDNNDQSIFDSETRGRKKGVVVKEDYKELPLNQQVLFLEAKLAFLNEAHHFFQKSRAKGYKKP
jgi:transposase